MSSLPEVAGHACIRGLQVVDCHGGFRRLASWVKADQRKTLACGVGLLSFAMSAVLDNLTTTILMLSILQVSKLWQLALGGRTLSAGNTSAGRRNQA